MVKDQREYEIRREGEKEKRNLKSEEILVFLPLNSYPLPLFHIFAHEMKREGEMTMGLGFGV